MKIFCISQARVGSTRLPNKVLKLINNKPLLKYHIERLKQVNGIDELIIATTNKPQDQAIVDFCQQHNIHYFCGDEDNVLSRFYHTAVHSNASDGDLIIRVTSDCPLIAPELIDSLIVQHKTRNSSGISNIDIQSYPRGFDAEIFTMAALTKAYQNANTHFQQEHVTPYFYQHAKQYPKLSINLLNNKGDRTNQLNLPLRLCVDEPADFELIEQLIDQYPNNILTANAQAIIDYLSLHPKLAGLNQQVQQKEH